MGLWSSRSWSLIFVIPLSLQFWTLVFCSAAENSRSYVLDLTAHTLSAAIAEHDIIFMEFYAPWCGHCQRLAPEYEKAAQLLAQSSPHIKLGRIDADKYKSISSEYHVNGYPTLRLFIRGSPVESDYEGPRSADSLVSYLRRAVSPLISTLASESELSSFLKNVSDSSPIFLGFGLEESVLKESATKYKKKAWFAVVQDISDKMMMDFDFDKKPALVVTHPHLMEQAVYYGPFEGGDMKDFVRQNLMPLVTKISSESLKLVRDDGRPIALGIYNGEQTESVFHFMKMLKSAAPANRGFIFAYVDAAMWPSFVKPFGIEKGTTLPTVVIWTGLVEYSTHEDEEAFIGRDAESKITKFLQDFKSKKVKLLIMKEPSFLEKAKDIIWGLPTLYMIITILILVWVLQGCAWKEIMRDGGVEEQHQQRERLRRADLEGDLGSERVIRDAGEPLVISRKVEKKTDEMDCSLREEYEHVQRFTLNSPSIFSSMHKWKGRCSLSSSFISCSFSSCYLKANYILFDARFCSANIFILAIF